MGLAPNSPAEGGVVPANRSLPPEQGDPLWLILGPQGLRAGWCILLFAALVYLFANIFGTLISSIVEGALHLQFAGQTALSSIVGELGWVLALAVTFAIMARIEHRRFLDYNLARPFAAPFMSGLLSGFVALSMLVAVMAWGGWIHFGPTPQYQAQIFRHAALWAVAFVLVALTEEGSFRCYLQYTLARGLNFWWAVALVGSMCLWDFTHAASHGAGGVYAMAALGLFPCLYIHLRKTPQNGFWQAAWAGSTMFAFIHTANNGETWIGILAAGAIGFVFCVSVRLTGSAWWAIGFHAAWDWAETFFYGTADSGFVAKGHLFTTSPAGSALWSGGTDGPEGSILILPIIPILLLALLLLYGRKRERLASAPVAENVAG
jgi:membrane protease YdiL (CAAX protease family)